jgi:recombination protein RecR
MDPISKLAALFAEFPGIGNRQSKRFVHYLLKRDRYYLDELAKHISELKNTIRECTDCHRYFTRTRTDTNVCMMCSDETRDRRTLMIVEKDSDMEALERSGTYRGQYFILGGTLPILEKNPDERIRISLLVDRISRENDNLDEVIIACAVTPESEHTAQYVEAQIAPLLHPTMTKVTHLGRGLSTGTELEYSDSETLRYALMGRK